MANSADPDQTAPVGAVWSGSALFAQAYLSENLGCPKTLDQYGSTDKVIALYVDVTIMKVGRSFNSLDTQLIHCTKS